LEESEGMRRTRGLFIVKSRGMGHSSDVHKLIMNDNGIALEPMERNTMSSRHGDQILSASITDRRNGRK
jgi:hypothetical protein